MKITPMIAVALALASSACATRWEKPGTTEQDLAQDEVICESQSEDAYAHVSGRLERLGTSLDKRGHFERCMIARGWRVRDNQTETAQAPVSEADLPLRFPVYSR